ncbi:G-protein coupled receptor 4-like [Xyrichtys novacula]|uniref:G-protein coupled receptor 4-like n=1 Tax=Xyrichtys novacula TaxID=13765 RepID=A0AAV1FXS7_XYRNO|nr:G-protein coupled receptor 4-like [Xyrichtys novacula]
MEVPSARGNINLEVYQVAVFASIGFTVSLSIERYMAIVHPLWYRIRRSIKSSVVSCAVVWIVSILYHLSGSYIVFTILVFLLLIFCLVKSSYRLGSVCFHLERGCIQAFERYEVLQDEEE